MEKKYSRDEITLKVTGLKEKGLKIGYTSGAFDIIHFGHVDYLKKAKQKCDILIVGVNSDRSIKEYKDKRRPILDEKSRLEVISSFEFVDYCFLFDDLNNNQNVQVIKPDLYIKAGDYRVEDLTSSKYMAQWGGETIFIDFIQGYSTTKAIETILSSYGYPKEIVLPYREKKPAVFLDRDGVINKDIGYLSDYKDFEFREGVLEGLKQLKEKGFRLIVVTNQAGIGMGYYSREDFYEVNRNMLEDLYNNQIILDKIYYCPHSLEDNCDCRKPKNGLFKRAIEECQIEVERSFMIGDKLSDIEAGEKTGIKSILIDNKKEHQDVKYRVESFLEAVSEILK